MGLSWISLFRIAFKKPQSFGLSTDILDLYEKYNSRNVCLYCQAKKPSGAHHCMKCKICVKVLIMQDFDHHCIYLNNCIGKGNYRRFVLYIAISILDYGCNIGIGVYLLCKQNNKIYYVLLPLFIPIFIFFFLRLMFTKIIPKAIRSRGRLPSESSKIESFVQQSTNISEMLSITSSEQYASAIQSSIPTSIHFIQAPKKSRCHC